MLLDPVGSGWRIEDVGTRNGTFVNGKRIETRHRLKHGDRFRVGETERCAGRCGSGRAPIPSSNQEIAERLRLSQSAVKEHIGNLLTKFKAAVWHAVRRHRRPGLLRSGVFGTGVGYPTVAVVRIMLG